MVSFEMTQRTQSWAVWSGFWFSALVAIGMGLFGGIIPPPSPAMNPIEITEFYNSNLFLFRVGMIMIMFGAALYIPFSAILGMTVARVEGRIGVMTISITLASFTNFILFFYPPLWWLTAAYRMDRSPELIQMMNDAAWLQYMGGLAPFLMIQAILAWTAFSDRSDNPVLPRWFGYWNIWVIFGLAPLELIFFFTDGVFAWNGLFGWWIPCFVFFGWIGSLVYVLHRAIHRSDTEQNYINIGLAGKR